MCKILKKYRNWSGPGLILVLLFSCNIAYSQTRLIRTPIKKINKEVFVNLLDRIPPFSRDTLSGPLSSPIPPIRPGNRNTIFYDSLKIRASKNRFTRELFNFLVVDPDTIYRKKFSRTSDVNYLQYAGKKIRRIEIHRLDVFGTDINYPLSENAKNYEKILNKTHFNTFESIIRKNLLFSEGDRVSPLALSENERLLRQLPFISDARIMISHVSDEEADIEVYTKDIYSIGGSYTFRGLKKGSVSIFDKNIFGLGHEFGFDVPFDNIAPNSPGIGFHYLADNIQKTFINLNLYYLSGLGSKTYGFDLSRKLVSSLTKYAGGVSFRHMYTTFNLNPVPVPVPYKLNLQDYWIERSFLINIESATRIIAGTRYTNNNVFSHPPILPDSYYNLQKYKLFLASIGMTVQKYTKTNLLYSYGRTEDVPYGGLLKFTTGREFNEFKLRTYLSGEIAYGNKYEELGYFYIHGALSDYLTNNGTEQGLLSLRLNYFSNLLNMGDFRIRNFVYANYTRGFGRYSNEYLKFNAENGFAGFKNDSTIGTQRLAVSLESVLFSPVNLYGFRFAFFGFSDFSFLSGTNQILGRGYILSSVGLGIRIRNDNLIFNTLQIRLAYYPNTPNFSTIPGITVSGEQLLRPLNFEPGPPSIMPYR